MSTKGAGGKTSAGKPATEQKGKISSKATSKPTRNRNKDPHDKPEVAKNTKSFPGAAYLASDKYLVRVNLPNVKPKAVDKKSKKRDKVQVDVVITSPSNTDMNCQKDPDEEANTTPETNHTAPEDDDVNTTDKLAEMEKKMSVLNERVDQFIGNDTKNVIIEMRNKVRRKRTVKLEPGASTLAESIQIRRGPSRNQSSSERSLSSSHSGSIDGKSVSTADTELSIADMNMEDGSSLNSLASGYNSTTSSQSSNNSKPVPSTSSHSTVVDIH